MSSWFKRKGEKMDGWSELMYGTPTEAELQQVRLEMGCPNCETVRGSEKCYTCLLVWAMDSIRGSIRRAIK